jgi:hypothetical protein
LFFGCFHVPAHDKRKLAGLLRLIREYRPDRLVALGDLIDADAASRWISEMKWSLQDEYNGLSGVLRRLEQAAPDAERVFFDGNHEDNLRAPGRIPEKVRMLVQPEKHVPELLRWGRVPYVNDRTGVRRWGQVTAMHGWGAGTHSDNQEAMVHGIDNGVTVRAHTHRGTQGPVRVKAGTQPVNRWYLNTGTMCDIRFFKEKHYGRRLNTKGWCFTPVLVDADEKATANDSRRWQCKQFWFDAV